MNLNIITYGLYFIINLMIIARTGFICYTNGKAYIKNSIPNNDQLVTQISNVLLTGYYLLNIGYAVVMIHNWTTINSIEQMIEEIAIHTAIIITILLTLHYFNLFLIYKYFKKI